MCMRDKNMIMKTNIVSLAAVIKDMTTHSSASISEIKDHLHKAGIISRKYGNLLER